MDVYKNSDGNFVCKICNSVHVQIQEALECAATHTKSTVVPEEMQLGPEALQVPAGMIKYNEDLGSDGMLKVAERLMMSLVEDYIILREKDLREKGNIGPMAYNAGKSAAEAVNTYTKLISGSKSSSLNVNIDANKKSDLAALKEMLNITDDGVDDEHINQ